MSNKVFKNYQINLGLPFQVKVPLEELISEDYFKDGGNMGADGVFTGGGLPLGYGAVMAGASASGAATAEEGGADSGGKALAEAEHIIRSARAEGAEIISNAEAEADRIIDASRRETDMYFKGLNEKNLAEAEELRGQAYLEGRREGMDEGKAEYESLIEEAARIRDEAEKEYSRLLEGAEGDALELVLSIAKKVIGGEITANRENLIFLIKDAFSHCTNKESVVLKVSSEDFEYISGRRDDLLSMSDGVDALEIKRDLSLAPGSCFIETPFGSLDAGVSTRLSRIEDAFYRVLAANRPAAGGLIA